MKKEVVINNKNCFISIVVPVYNEEKVISLFWERLKSVVSKLGVDYEVIFCLDPSSDDTEKIILKLREIDARIKLVKMSRRFGQPAATLAGIYYCKGDACLIIDCDLQDPPELLLEMFKKWQEGHKVVYAQRISRKGETVIKKLITWLGYWVTNKITHVKIPRNAGDFRLIDRAVIDKINNLKDYDGFLRGMVAYVGHSQVAVPYDRGPRMAGKTKYNRFFGSLTIGFNGIFGFSKYPLHLISLIGVAISAGSFFLALTYFLLKILNYPIVWGNPTLVILISFLSGVQLLSLGIIGQYMARIYEGVLNRPRFIVEEKYGFEDQEGIKMQEAS